MALHTSRIPLNESTVKSNPEYPDPSAGLVPVVYIRTDSNYLPFIVTTNNRGLYAIRSNGKNKMGETLLETATRELDEEFYNLISLFMDAKSEPEHLAEQLKQASWCMMKDPNTQADGRSFPYTTVFTIFQGKRFESKEEAMDAIGQVNALADMLTPFGSALFAYKGSAMAKRPDVAAKFDEVVTRYQLIVNFIKKLDKSPAEQLAAARMGKLIDLSEFAREFSKFVDDPKAVKDTAPLIRLVDSYTECSQFSLAPSRLALARVILGDICKKAAKQLGKKDNTKMQAEEKAAVEAQSKLLKSAAAVGASEIIQFLFGSEKVAKAATDTSFTFTHATQAHVEFVQLAFGLSQADYKMLLDCIRNEKLSAAQVHEILGATDGATIKIPELLVALEACGKLTSTIRFGLENPRAPLDATVTALMQSDPQQPLSSQHQMN